MAGALVLAVTVPLIAVLISVWSNGWTIESVQSGSMDPHVPRGSAVVVAPADPDDIGVGTVIAFTDPNAKARTVIHRVRRIVDREGIRSFETQGDANAVPDRDLVPMRLVQGRVTRHIVGLGGMVDWVADRGHARLLLIVPAAAFGLNEVLAARQRRRARAEAAEVTVLRARVAELELAFSNPPGG